MGIRRFFLRRRWDQERARELQAHLALETDDQIARGVPPAEARAIARRKLGNTTRIREEIYRMNTVTAIETFWQDLKFGVRSLRRAPTFAAVAVLTLGLGIGANTAIFQLVDALRLRRLPVADPAGLVTFRIEAAKNGRTGGFFGDHPLLTGPLWEQIRDHTTAFSGSFAWHTERLDTSAAGESSYVRGLWVSGELFSTLGVRPARGRLIAGDDDRAGCAAPVAVLSHPYWHRAYGSRPDIVGQTVRVERHEALIIGVSEPKFFGLEVGQGFDIALPLCAEPLVAGSQSRLPHADNWWLAAIGRLQPGWSVERATAELQSLSPGIFAATVPASYTPAAAADYRGFRLGAHRAASGLSALRGQYQAPLWLLLGIAGVVLAIACANLANLMLARATARERELAIRLAIGAPRRSLVRQLLSESLLLAAGGALLGLWLARVLSRLLVSLLSTRANPLFLDLPTDLHVLGFAGALALLTTLLFGLLPALRATRTPPAEAIRSGGRGNTEGRERLGVRRALVVGQVAVSLVLVAGALLFVRSLAKLAAVDPGFRADEVTVALLDLGAGAEGEALFLLQRDLLERLRATPEVAEAASATIVPLSGGGWNNGIVIDGVLQEGYPLANRVSVGFFATLDIPLLAGRLLDQHDTATAPAVAVVNRTFAAKYLDGQPVGRRFRIDVGPGQPDPEYEIVGLVGDTKYYSLREANAPIMFFAAAQDPAPSPLLPVLLRSAAPLDVLRPATLRTVAEVAPAARVSLRSLPEQIEESVLLERLMAGLSGAFGVLAVLLAMTGLYGVMVYLVTSRRNEIGLRMALGATRPQVLRLVGREAVVLVGIGAPVGIVLTLLAGRAAAPLLFGLASSDPASLALALLVLLLVAAGASLVPAWRASRVPPTVALRAD